jgi:hypothetical protein
MAHIILFLKTLSMDCASFAEFTLERCVESKTNYFSASIQSMNGHLPKGTGPLVFQHTREDTEWFQNTKISRVDSSRACPTLFVGKNCDDEPYLGEWHSNTETFIPQKYWDRLFDMACYAANHSLFIEVNAESTASVQIEKVGAMDQPPKH